MNAHGLTSTNALKEKELGISRIVNGHGLRSKATETMVNTRALYAITLVLVVVIAFGVLKISDNTDHRVEVARVLGELDHERQELVRAKGIIFNLPGGIVRVDA